MSKYLKVVFAAISLWILASLFVPYFGRTTPSARFASAKNEARILWQAIDSYSEEHGKNRESVETLIENSRFSLMVSSFFEHSTHRVSGITFRDVKVATQGRILFAADAPMREPSTKTEIRIVVHSFGPPFYIPESDYQRYIVLPPTIKPNTTQ